MSTPETKPTTMSGKTCLITGGAGGLGRAIATEFLRAGANVVVCDINKERLAQMKSSPELAAYTSLTAVAGDITSIIEMEKLVDDILEKHQTLDILINNAAVMDRFEPVGDVDLELWNKVAAVNLTAPLLLSKLAVRAMLKQQNPSGSIINIASGAAKAGWLAGVAYTASKHGLIGLTKSTASFYGPKGIRCNALMLGVMPGTNMTDAFTQGVHQEGRQKVGEILSGLPPQPCDLNGVGELCVSLSGAGWSIVNGSVIAVDNGWTCVVG